MLTRYSETTSYTWLSDCKCWATQLCFYRNQDQGLPTKRSSEDSFSHCWRSTLDQCDSRRPDWLSLPNHLATLHIATAVSKGVWLSVWWDHRQYRYGTMHAQSALELAESVPEIFLTVRSKKVPLGLSKTSLESVISSQTHLAMLIEDYLWAKMRQFNTVPGSKLPPVRCNGHFNKLSAKCSRRAEKFQVQAASSVKDAVDNLKKTVTEKISQPADKAKDTADRVSETISAPPLAPSAIASVPKEETVLLQGLLSVLTTLLIINV